MDAVRQWFESLTSGAQVVAAIRAAITLVVGVVLAFWLPRRVRRLRLNAQQALILRIGLRYLILLLTVTWALRLLGVDLSVLFGAAGILTVAIGFAAQTSASNWISGLFLMIESHFKVGDIVTVGDTTGEVTSIDPLSIKVRTFDNLSVRIPNETMLKSNVTNLTQYPIRRVDLTFVVGFRTDLARLSEAMVALVSAMPLALDEPAPLVLFTGHLESGIGIQFSVWATRPNFFALKNELFIRLQQLFADEGIHIPYPHRTLAMPPGAELPIRVHRLERE